MVTEDGEDVQREERGGLKRKPTGPPKLLLGRSRTRSSGEDQSEDQQMEDERSGRCSDAAAESKDELTCRGRHNAAGDREGKRRRWWSRFFTAVACIRRNKEARRRLEKPSAEVLQESDSVSLNDREDDKELVIKEKPFKMRKMFRRFMTSPDVQRASSQSRADRSPQSLQKKLQKVLIRGEKRQLTENMEDTKVEECRCVSELTDGTDGTPEAEMNVQPVEDQATAEGPESLKPSPEEDWMATGDRLETFQTANMKVPVQVVSSEEDQVLHDSKVNVDLHDPLPSEVPPVEKTPRSSQTAHPSINGPSIRIELCPPDDISQEEEEEECWEGISSSENHLHLLLCFSHSEQQLHQTARSLVQSALTAAVDQLSRERQ